MACLRASCLWTAVDLYNVNAEMEFCLLINYFFFFRSCMCRCLIWFTLKILKWKNEPDAVGLFWRCCYASHSCFQSSWCEVLIEKSITLWKFWQNRAPLIEISLSHHLKYWKQSWLNIVEIGAISDAVLAHNDCRRQATQTNNRKVKNANFFVTWFIVTVFLLHC